jgi:uncharacterized membrane protein (UPF0127 family)
VHRDYGKQSKQRKVKAHNLNNGKELSSNVIVADRVLKRMKGLLGKSELPSGEALWIKPCMSVHTFFMRFPIDVVFLNRKNQVVALEKNLFPNRLTRLYPKAVSVLELPSGTIDATSTGVGDEIEIA